MSILLLKSILTHPLGVALIGCYCVSITLPFVIKVILELLIWVFMCVNYVTLCCEGNNGAIQIG